MSHTKRLQFWKIHPDNDFLSEDKAFRSSTRAGNEHNCKPLHFALRQTKYKFTTVKSVQRGSCSATQPSLFMGTDQLHSGHKNSKLVWIAPLCVSLNRVNTSRYKSILNGRLPLKSPPGVNIYSDVYGGRLEGLGRISATNFRRRSRNLLSLINISSVARPEF